MTIGSGSSDNRGFTKTFTPLSGGGHSEYSIGGSNSDWSEWESSTDPTPIDSDDPTTGTSYQLAGATSDFTVISTDIGPGRFSWNRSDDFQTGESTQDVTVTPEGTTVGFTNDSATTTTNRWRATSNEGDGAFSSSRGFSFSDTTSFSGGTVSEDISTVTVRNFSTGNAWANSKQRSAGSADGGQGSTVTTTHDSRGTQRSGATVNNGRVSSSYSDANGRSEDTTTNEGYRQAPGGNNGSRTDTDTTTQGEGQTTIGRGYEWSYGPFYLPLGPEDGQHAVQKTIEGSGSGDWEITTGGGKKESAETNSELKETVEIRSVWFSGATKHTKTSTDTTESESHYDSSHTPGENGAENGTFESTRSSKHEPTITFVDSWDYTSSEDYWQNEPEDAGRTVEKRHTGELTTTISGETSESSARETGGKYSDNANGRREQSADFTFVSKTGNGNSTEEHKDVGWEVTNGPLASSQWQIEGTSPPSLQNSTKTDTTFYITTTDGSYDNKGEESETSSDNSGNDNTTGGIEHTGWSGTKLDPTDLTDENPTGGPGPSVKNQVSYPQVDEAEGGGLDSGVISSPLSNLLPSGPLVSSVLFALTWGDLFGVGPIAAEAERLEERRLEIIAERANKHKEQAAEDREQAEADQAFEELADSIQDALGWAGFLPIVGTAADIFNAGVSVARGNYGEAAISLIASLPIVGDAAKLAAKPLIAAAEAAAGPSLKAAGSVIVGAFAKAGDDLPTGRVADPKKVKGGVGPVNQGKAGEALSEARALAEGETIRGKQPTLELPSGKRSRPDTLTETAAGNSKIREAKKGANARLTDNQKELKKAIDSGQPVIPRGKRAEEAGLKPGVPTIIEEFVEDRFE